MVEIPEYRLLEGPFQFPSLSARLVRMQVRLDRSDLLDESGNGGLQPIPIRIHAATDATVISSFRITLLTR